MIMQLLTKANVGVMLISTSLLLNEMNGNLWMKGGMD